jgi:hypothetical protein
LRGIAQRSPKRGLDLLDDAAVEVDHGQHRRIGLRLSHLEQHAVGVAPLDRCFGIAAERHFLEYRSIGRQAAERSPVILHDRRGEAAVGEKARADRTRPPELDQRGARARISHRELADRIDDHPGGVGTGRPHPAGR